MNKNPIWAVAVITIVVLASMSLVLGARPDPVVPAPVDAGQTKPPVVQTALADAPKADDIVPAQKEPAEPAHSLPTVGDEATFIRLMDEMNERLNIRSKQSRFFEIGIETEAQVTDMDVARAENKIAAGVAAPAAATPAPQASARDMAEPVASSDYSQTNVQVEGVDEADVIKTDGAYIYYANNDRISIVKASPANSMSLVSTMEFTEFSPREMYVDGDSLTVIGNAMRLYYVNGVRNYQTMTRACVYDISDRANPREVRVVESEGDYLSSRKVGNAVYLLSSSWVYKIAPVGVYNMPMYRDTAVAEAYQDISYRSMCYFPEFITNNFLFVTGFETDKPEQSAKIETFLGAGQSVYASVENMYVSASEYAKDTVDTTVHKFALDSGTVTYSGKQSVPGTILNQFSMDEHNGYFRIATTAHNNRNNPVNALYVLDKDLKHVGKIEDIAPGETIYSVRFMQNRAYMVTFKTVDPLFVIDLANPTQPKILGALKIPGYSDYLHPYDENHLIGFGKDTVEVKGTALYQGMKISLFDVTDVSNPKEKFVEIIGDRGTESPLLHNHKALLFDKSRDLLAFPISVAQLSPQQKLRSDNSVFWDYGAFTFQGAYVYTLDLENGFRFKGGVTHMDEQDMLKSGLYDWNYNKAVERIIRIGENVFTASPELIKSTAIEGMKDLGSVKLSK